MAAPYEIMAVPFDIYLAPVGTDEPDINTTPAGDWDLLGVRGADEYDEAGITVTHEQEINLYRGLRGTGPIKAFRTSEGLTLGLTVNDLTLETYGLILNDSDVDDLGDDRAVKIHMGPQVATHALLMRSPDGPYGDGAPCQLYVPKVFQSGSPAVVHRKGQPAGLALTFTALEDLDAVSEDERFGVFRAIDTPGS